MAKILITGGAGFIGSNLAYRLLEQEHNVTIFDNLSRAGGENNIRWLRDQFGQDGFYLVRADLTDFNALRKSMSGMEQIYHLAGQVAVTASIEDPRADFEDNALGTFNVLEAARLYGKDPIVIYASTNKVYGGMEEVEVIECTDKFAYANMPHGIPETFPLDFHSPYGCSKGAGDQYVRDYHRIYGLKTVVMRQSCIYGYRQFGIEDQGWLAWFTIAALKQRPITIYGNGKQVRDVLFIEDLLDAYEAAVTHIDRTAGQIYNVGGGPENTLSIWSQFGPILESLLGQTVTVSFSAWREGDQRIYVSDIRKIKQELGWTPQVNVKEGITRMNQWIQDNQHLFSHL